MDNDEYRDSWDNDFSNFESFDVSYMASKQIIINLRLYCIKKRNEIKVRGNCIILSN